MELTTGESVFKINSDGTGFTNLHSYTGSDGRYPYGSLILSEGVLYGMANYGAGNRGVVFRLTTNGTNYTNIYGFPDSLGNPRGDLTLVDGVLFGMTYSAPNPTINKGCIFKIDTLGNNFKLLHRFIGGTTDGQGPHGSLVYANKKLYGMTVYGGSGNQGCIFTIDSAGTNYKHLYNFSGCGSYPNGSLTLNDSVLYGMGGSCAGTIFKIDTTGNNFSKLLNFQENVTGYSPKGSLLLNSGILYGMTSRGGSGGQGNLFKIDITGNNFFQIYDFNGAYNGKSMYGSLTPYNNVFYGMTSRGGSKNLGCVFKINSDGTGYTRLMDFDSINGALPYGDLLLTGDFFYGMTSEGGASNKGCIFKIKPDGTGYIRMVDFDGTNYGANPYGSLVAIGDSLYGMTYAGGTGTIGCIFVIKTDGTGFTKLIDFNGTEKGGRPYGSLAVLGSMLYGMTSLGGSHNYGNLFKVNSDGTGFSTIVNFNGTSAPYGSSPRYTTPVIIGNSLYGMTYSGATSDQGCIFKVDLTTSSYSNVSNFSATGNGSHPYGSLTLYGKSLYGLTCDGGTNGVGCIFKRDTLGLFNAKIYSFIDSSGTYPYGSFINYHNELYGATNSGGNSGLGTIFKYTLTPDSQADAIIVSNTTIHWTNGNGMIRAVFLKEGTGIITNPDKITYTASSDWANKGSELGSSGYYCIYNGAGDSVTVAGLSPKTNYTVQIFEYNGSSGNEQYFDSTATDNPFSFSTSKFTPAISWSNPADITYGTSLDTIQLNATTNIPGNFIYTPDTGTILNAGFNQALTVNFTPTDTAGYFPASKTVYINVLKAEPLLNWNNPADIIYGTPLDTLQLNAFADVPGSFVYYPDSGSILSAGQNQILNTWFTPIDTLNYDTAFKSVVINVFKAEPEITWSNPEAIVYGTPLSNTQLNAEADISGSFFYNPSIGAILNTGLGQVLQSIFTPSDTLNYDTASASVFIDVYKAEPIVTWNNSAAITYGTQLSNTQLNATADVGGAFVYIPAAGTMLNVGDDQTLHVDFTPTDTANYDTASKIVFINVIKAVPVITWNNPAAITYGTVLSNIQLNATADVGGAFVYIPAAGTLLNAGLNQLLQTYFTPTDITNYDTASKTATINVNKAEPILTWNNPADIIHGTLLSDTQLNATANISGAFLYTPPAGTHLEIGDNQPLRVDFTPVDATNYDTAATTVFINVIEDIGLDQLLKHDFTFYPNPVKEILIIRSQGNLEMVILTDILGVERIRVSGNDIKEGIPVHALEKGIYFVTIIANNKQIFISKMVKE